MDARAANDRIAEKATQLRFVSRVPMLCECSRPDCRTTVMIALPEYHDLRADPEAFLTAPGHVVEGAKPASETSAYEIQNPHHTCDDGNGDRRSAWTRDGQ